MIRSTGVYALAMAGGYLSTTFTLWFAHWFAHLRGGPLTGFHVRGHHALYATSGACLSDTFRYGKGWQDSVYAFIPWLGVLASGIWWFLPPGVAVAVTVEAAVVVGLFSYVHEQFHVTGSRLERSAGFRGARAHHFRHHDRAVNFAVYDHTWDRVFGTYED